MSVRSLFNTDFDVVSFQTGLLCEDLSRAKQSEAAATDINVIVRNFGVTGLVPTSPIPAEYGDFTGIDNYQDALHALMAAETAFSALPSGVRRRFGNDPAEFVNFVSDPRNIDEVRKMGLAPALPVDSAPAENGFPAPADGSTPAAVPPAE